MFNSTKPNLHKQIENLQRELQERESSRANLSQQQDQIGSQLQELQEAIATAQQQLTELEAQKLREEQEAALSAEIRELRAIANQVNELSNQLAVALEQFRHRAKSAGGAPLYKKVVNDEAIKVYELPYIQHQTGSDYFYLKNRTLEARQ